ncbi:dihydroneopterin aldolase [Nitrosomonas communis]|uniref:dihydroneopterin aldolase n=1 Tax=Nitrosomonas communis TaxID=44574 RepID=UPI0026F256FA|nr:dihydroneopterin aldolase [Nitrosomonas communis]MCO6426824.1 dihydroneopterin aldolase [Nitrosomonas communis]
MDTIFLQGFQAKTLIGIYPWEKKIAQTIELNLEIALPTNRACFTDNLEDSLDYSLIVKRINDTLATKHFCLLEALAEHIAQIVLIEFNSPWVKVSVAKLDIIQGVKKLGICIERKSTLYQLTPSPA